jgi:hypothetical protein
MLERNREDAQRAPLKNVWAYLSCSYGDIPWNKAEFSPTDSAELQGNDVSSRSLRKRIAEVEKWGTLNIAGYALGRLQLYLVPHDLATKNPDPIPNLTGLIKLEPDMQPHTKSSPSILQIFS